MFLSLNFRLSTYLFARRCGGLPIAGRKSTMKTLCLQEVE